MISLAPPLSPSPVTEAGLPFSPPPPPPLTPSGSVVTVTADLPVGGEASTSYLISAIVSDPITSLAIDTRTPPSPLPPHRHTVPFASGAYASTANVMDQPLSTLTTESPPRSPLTLGLSIGLSTGAGILISVLLFLLWRRHRDRYLAQATQRSHSRRFRPPDHEDGGYEMMGLPHVHAAGIPTPSYSSVGCVAWDGKQELKESPTAPGRSPVVPEMKFEGVGWESRVWGAAAVGEGRSAGIRRVEESV